MICYTIPMENKVLNYRIIIEREPQKDGSCVYISYCPPLGISDFGKSVEEAKEHIHEAIECHIQGLTKLGELVPLPDMENSYISQALVSMPKNIKFAY